MPQGGSGHRELLGLLCGIRGALPLEEALGQDVSDEPEFARLINVVGLRGVCVCVAFRTDGEIRQHSFGGER